MPDLQTEMVRVKLANSKEITLQEEINSLTFKINKLSEKLCPEDKEIIRLKRVKSMCEGKLMAVKSNRRKASEY